MKVLNEREKKLRQIAMMNLNVGNKTEKEAAKKFLKDIGLSDESIEKIEGKGKKKEKVEESLNEEHIITGINDEKQAQETLKKKGILFNKIDREDKNSIFIFVKDGKKLKIGSYNPVKKELVITNMNESLNEECQCEKCPEEKHKKCKKPTKKAKKMMSPNDEIEESETLEECGCNDNKDSSDRILNILSKKKKKIVKEEEKEQCECGSKEFNKTFKYTTKDASYESDKPFKVCKKCGNVSKIKNLKEEEIKDKINSVDMAQGALKAKNINWNKTEKVGNKTVWKNGDTIVGAWDPSWGTIRTGEDLLK